MSGALAPATRVDELLARRTEANERFFTAEAERLARLCHRMAERFARVLQASAAAGNAATNTPSVEPTVEPTVGSDVEEDG